jgi:hypothetical protein
MGVGAGNGVPGDQPAGKTGGGNAVVRCRAERVRARARKRNDMRQYRKPMSTLPRGGEANTGAGRVSRIRYRPRCRLGSLGLFDFPGPKAVVPGVPNRFTMRPLVLYVNGSLLRVF